jgi:hypothetical protein
MALSDQSEGGRERRGMRHRGDKSMSSGWRRGDSRAEKHAAICAERPAALEPSLQVLGLGCMLHYDHQQLSRLFLQRARVLYRALARSQKYDPAIQLPIEQLQDGR